MTFSELEIELKKIKHEGPLKLNDCTTILDVEKCITSHLGYLNSNTGNKAYMPYYSRLIKIYERVSND